MDAKELKAPEFLDQVERELFEAIQSATLELDRDDPGKAQHAKAEFDREDAEARARVAVTREETGKRFFGAEG